MALILFDLNGTLLDPGSHKDKLQAAVRLAMIHTLADDFRPFAELLEAAGGTVPEEMPPFTDVPDGLDGLKTQGHRLAVLTNSARATAEQHLQAAGLRERFERVIGVDAVGAYKPDGRAYAYALAQMGATAQDTWLVAAHDWDVVGAQGAGLRTAFIARGGPRPVTIEVDRDTDALTKLEI
jgi:2-haloacid dehalogenase